MSSTEKHIAIRPNDTPEEARRKVRLASFKWRLDDAEKAVSKAYYPDKLISARVANLFEAAIKAAREENGI